ncbi:adenosine deaminase [Eremomyces bilateralis CBS 781.70]|uniref:Adenosine deaminase n=1 Tax=Eremomyces bilateralis CBS 781.70 TaxID=1392243 RepID=A0A6G1G823_9PEZI|nr:adenosine deaminase [Eremomyces bilateralis CBS 781.70]KAF1814255.1 adenosine deaminase [Eremomyces bilateralis CBS 781.70]
MESGAVDLKFTKALPKIELHAHLSGSISRKTLHQIWITRRESDPSFELEDPLTALPPEKTEMDVKSFFPIFDDYIYSLLSTPSAVTHAVTSVLRDFLADGVRYIELRTTPRKSETMSAEEYIQTVLQAISDWHLSRGFQPPEDSANPRIRAKLIISLDRRYDELRVQTVIGYAIKYRSQGIVGIDLCGHPQHPIDQEVLRHAFRRAAEAGLAVTVHFAETPASASRPELEFLLSKDVGARRLGHVCRVPEDLREQIISEGRGVEMCLSCNVMAKLTDGGFPGHHFKDWWERDGGGESLNAGQARAKVTLCTDDVGVFGSPLSNEFLIVSQHFGRKTANGQWHPLSRVDCWSICRTACGMMFGGDGERKRMESILEDFRSNILHDTG